MEEQINKLIEKIESDSMANYTYDEVLDMLKDLLPVENLNKEVFTITQLNYNLLEVVRKDVIYEIVEEAEQESCCFIKTTDFYGKCFKCGKQVFK